ncbi:secretory phospholipase A2 [Alternaria rosae]|uniref:secretory phospholipase A2 n=1 Tax=Alternaria rosae TaxID=1187941 RepID=UPI001E8DE8A0|nr:secretory phospholipase A2 [Alternaria rosae]KAH6875055.1 secretory phospholipase A2 [Alternaria rosae]
MKFTILTALLGFASLAVSAPAQLVERQGTLEQVTDSYMFDISIAEFIANRNGKVGPPELNWESNGCTASPDNPFGFDFLNSCYRHDFGYRNYKQQGRFDAMKARTDDNFKTDMFNQCATESAKGPCEATATLYYEAVKAFGKREEETME